VSDTYDLFCALIDEHGYTPLDAADSLHLDFATKERYRKRRNKQAQRGSQRPVSNAIDIRIPQNGGPPPLQPIVLPDANAMLLFDLHIPHHNVRLLEQALTVKQRFFPHIPRLIIGGDLFDGASISRFPKDEQEAGIAEELALGGEILRELARHFDTVYLTNGNHDRRFTRLAGGLTLQNIIDMALGARRPDGEPIVTNLDYLQLDAPGTNRRWCIGHPSGYSGDGGKTPAAIALRRQVNVATGHNHHIGIQQSACGNFLGWDVGHCLSPERINYKVQSLSKFNEWSAGFGFIEDGYAYAYTERHTNWSQLGL
jgi:hypothetical protein